MHDKVNHCWCFSLSTLRCGVVTVVALWLMVAPGVVITTASATGVQRYHQDHRPFPLYSCGVFFIAHENIPPRDIVL